MKMWPYNPGGRWPGGRIRRRLLYMHQVAECIKYLQSSVCTHRGVYSYIYIYIYIYIIDMVISACGVFVNTILLPDDIPWVSTSMCE